ncbi:MAG TPA: four helix bundle protein [Pyrinomonadaceae bacterium]|nr:four helix bundle protein [Pyrinomonadaceae bacterium]
MAPTNTRKHASSKLVPITERAFAFAVRIVKLCKYLEKHTNVSRSVINQLLDAGTSIGANLEEAVAGQSRADFIHKNAISLKEARESNFWLRLILATEPLKPAAKTGILQMVQESSEIAKIVAKRIVTSKNK